MSDHPLKYLLPRAAAALMLAAPVAVAAQQGLGDPTRPTSFSEPDQERPAAAAPRWRLQSTLVADTRRLAVINGRTVAPGGRIDGATLLEVRQDGVTLESDGRRINLRVLQGAVDVKRGG